jgi:hypothetical protein
MSTPISKTGRSTQLAVKLLEVGLVLLGFSMMVFAIVVQPDMKGITIHLRSIPNTRP